MTLAARSHRPGRGPGRATLERTVNNIIWLVGAIVIILAILSFFGLR